MPRPPRRAAALKRLFSGRIHRGTRVAFLQHMHTRLGDILMRYYRVREDQIDAALDAGGFLGEALVRQQSLTEHDLARALAFQLGLPVAMEIAHARISEHVLAAIPRGIAAWEQIVP